MKYSRRCHCRHNCGHLARGSEALQPAERLLELEGVEAILVDCAAAYDSDSLHYDPACEIHGDRAVSNGTCSCKGDPTSAMEFVQAIILDIRSARASAQARPAGQPNRRRDGIMRMVANG